MVEYLLEAKRFIEYARAAYSAEARDQDLDMAEWCITRAIEEAGHEPRNRRRPNQRVKRRPSRTNGQIQRPQSLGTARYPRERLGGNENSAVRIERSFSIVGLTRDLLD